MNSPLDLPLGTDYLEGHPEVFPCPSNMGHLNRQKFDIRESRQDIIKKVPCILKSVRKIAPIEVESSDSDMTKCYSGVGGEALTAIRVHRLTCYMSKAPEPDPPHQEAGQ